MAAKNVGTLILEGRTAKKLSQTALANEVGGLSGSDIGKAERGEKELTQAQLKAIAKVLGITQKSLLEAPKGGTAAAAKKTSSATAAAKKTSSSTAAKKTTASKTGTAAKTSSAAKTTAKKTSAKTGTAAKTSAVSSVKDLSTTEKKLVELYREASADNKKLATRILKGDKIDLGELLPMLMSSGAVSEDGLLGSLLGKLQGKK